MLKNKKKKKKKVKDILYNDREKITKLILCGYDEGIIEKNGENIHWKLEIINDKRKGK